MSLDPRQIGQAFLFATVNDRTTFAQFAQLLSAGDLQTLRETAERMQLWVDQEIQIKVAE